MGRPFILPDVNDCSPNQPIELVSPAQVVGYYNQENKADKMKNVTDKVKSWYTEKAISAGWKSAKFAGSQCILDSGLEKGEK